MALFILAVIIFIIADITIRYIAKRIQATKAQQEREEVLKESLKLDFTREAKTLKRAEIEEPKARILCVDDETVILDSFRKILVLDGYSVDTVENGKEALGLIQTHSYDFVFTDLKMPEMDGMSLTRQIQQICPQTSVIIITAHGSLESAIEALRIGAYDYILKPFDFDDVLYKIRRWIKQKELVLENKALRHEVEQKYSFSNIVGQSPQMKKIFELIKKVANTKGNVLITGSSGTGKELVARAIHYNSDRKNKPFVAINCGAIVGNLMESEFFGHKKGSFTGAVRDKDGHFKMAVLIPDGAGE